MRRLLALLFSIIASTFLFAQEIQIVSFEPTLDLSAKLNPVFDSNGQACALLRVNLPTDDAFFEGNIVGTPARDHNDWLVYVPAGTRFLRITVKGYPSINYDFPLSTESFFTYIVKVSLKSDKNAGWRSVVVASYNLNGARSTENHNSITANQQSFGLMLGVVKKYGVYLRIRSNGNGYSRNDDDDVYIDNFGKCLYKIDREREKIEYAQPQPRAWLDTTSVKGRFAVTVGSMYHICRPLFLYGGLGYGYRSLSWKSKSGDEYYLVDSCSKHGVEIEAGILLRIKYLALTAGFQTTIAKYGTSFIPFKYSEVSIGVGYFF